MLLAYVPSKSTVYIYKLYNVNIYGETARRQQFQKMPNTEQSRVCVSVGMTCDATKIQYQVTSCYEQSSLQFCRVLLMFTFPGFFVMVIQCVVWFNFGELVSVSGWSEQQRLTVLFRGTVRRQQSLNGPGRSVPKSFVNYKTLCLHHQTPKNHQLPSNQRVLISLLKSIQWLKW